MPDEADLAFDAEQDHLTRALAQQHQHSTLPRPAGYCHNCGSAEVGHRLFCDSECAADWEHQFRVRRKLGLRQASNALM